MSLNSCIESKLFEQIQLKKQTSTYRVLEQFPHKNTARDFSTNDYLNLRTDVKVIEAGILAAHNHGAGAGSSRLVVETNGLINSLEEYCAKELNFENALFFPSGFVANESFFDAISSLSDIDVFVDHRVHASLFFGLRASHLKFKYFRHNDYIHLSEQLKHSTKSIKLIVLESIHSTDGTILNANKIIHICQTHNACVYLDDSHGFGVLGNGKGYAAEYPLIKPYLFAVSFGCGKSVGVSGGFLLSSYHSFKDYMIQHAKHLMFSTGISPFILGAVQQSLKIILGEEGNQRRLVLFDRIKFFKNALKNEVSNTDERSPIIPIILGKNELALNASEELKKESFFVKCLRPPTVPRLTSRLRVSIQSQHTIENLELLAQSIYKIL